MIVDLAASIPVDVIMLQFCGTVAAEDATVQRNSPFLAALSVLEGTVVLWYTRLDRCSVCTGCVLWRDFVSSSHQKPVTWRTRAGQCRAPRPGDSQEAAYHTCY
jgi:hypothetical protein